MPYLDPLSECTWREHPYERGIIVSDNGRVLSYKSGKEHELKPSDNGRGYLTVSVGARNPRYVHVLVAETFIPNHDKCLEVNHKDGNKKNNNVRNLEWCTRGANLTHACETGLNVSQKPIRIVETGEIFRSQNECARRIGGTASGIHDCRSGRHVTHRGYHFEFLDDDGLWHKTDRENMSKRRRVTVLETGVTYDSVSECARAINGTVCGILSCRTGDQRTHRGYHFKFYDGGDHDA